MYISQVFSNMNSTITEFFLSQFLVSGAFVDTVKCSLALCTRALLNIYVESALSVNLPLSWSFVLLFITRNASFRTQQLT